MKQENFQNEDLSRNKFEIYFKLKLKEKDEENKNLSYLLESERQKFLETKNNLELKLNDETIKLNELINQKVSIENDKKEIEKVKEVIFNKKENREALTIVKYEKKIENLKKDVDRIKYEKDEEVKTLGKEVIIHLLIIYNYLD